MRGAGDEKAYESFIEETMTHHGWLAGSPSLWDKQNALFPHYLLQFIRDTQPELFNQLEKTLGVQTGGAIVESLIRRRRAKGLPNLLHKGFECKGLHFFVASPEPAHRLSPEAVAIFKKNRFHLTRQVPCHPEDRDTVDLVLSLNGLPVAVAELKNPNTGQNRYNAMTQYRLRNPQAPLFRFKEGALVFFAVDPDQIFMTTRLDKDQTRFLPFNRGSRPGSPDCGKGNPLHPTGHRTAWLWEETLAPDSFLDILFHYIHLEISQTTKKTGKGKQDAETRETLIFPRYHQLDAVRKLTGDVLRAPGGGHYLIQHSAGSGKTHTIAWLAYRLAALHRDDHKVFDSVIIISDRNIIDTQLQKAVHGNETSAGYASYIKKHSGELTDALASRSAQIIVTTLQKFLFVLDKLPDPTGSGAPQPLNKETRPRQYAVIIDEAHSGQTGEAAVELRKILGAAPGGDDENQDWEDNFNRLMRARGRRRNIAFFAFTATPKAETVELFGHPGPDGVHRPFHLYSMKQAIEEGFILDVLKNYTTWTAFFRLNKTSAEDPLLPAQQTRKKLARFVAFHPDAIGEKIRVIIEHFRKYVKPKLEGRAKAMVVAGSRLAAVRYMEAFRDYIAENGCSDARPLAAFSGEVTDPDSGKTFREPDMNIDPRTGKKITETELPGRFKSSDYNILIAADKYQTGFDQPLLYAMYVDKPLSGVRAVQTLSRLNRVAPGKESVFILDFVNTADDIAGAFAPYYRVAELERPSDLGLPDRLKNELETFHVIHWAEIEGFCRVFFKSVEHRRPSDHGEMEKWIQPVMERFRQLEEERQAVFYKKVAAFADSYEYIAMIAPYEDRELEMWFVFCKALSGRLRLEREGEGARPEDNVALEYYRLEKTWTGSLAADVREGGGLKGLTDAGGGGTPNDGKPFSEIIAQLNTQFGGLFGEAERSFLERVGERALHDGRVRDAAKSNPTFGNFMLGVQKSVNDFLLDLMDVNMSFATRCLTDGEFRDKALELFLLQVYGRLRKEEGFF